MKRWIILLGGMIFLSAPSAAAENGKISGYAFGDFYFVLNHHLEKAEGRNGFWFRRIYFTYDREIAKNIDVRFRLEMASPGLLQYSNKMMPFVKDAYVRWKTGQYQFFLGISQTPTWARIEKVWGYRSVEKTPLDLQKWGSSRDFGLGVKGALNRAGTLRFHAMFGNGSGYRSEDNKGKKFLVSLAYSPTENFLLEFYWDFEDLPGAQDIHTLQAFAAFAAENMRIGMVLARQAREGHGPIGTDLQLDLLSVFAAGTIRPNLKYFVRMDKIMDPNPKGAKVTYLPFDPLAEFLFLVGGIDYEFAPGIHLMPNVEWVVYEKRPDGSQPGSDLIPRLTFFYKF